MAMVRVGSVGIHVQEWGAGEPLMMVHGLGMSSELWVHQAPALSKHYRMIAIDLRGFGRSDRPTEPGSYDIEILAADVAAVARSLGIERMHFLGTSMGGFVGLALAAAEPTLCRSLILCHTAPRSTIPPEIMATRLSLLRETPLEEYGRTVARQAFGPDAGSELHEWMVQLIARNDRRSYTQVLAEALPRFDAGDRVESIRVPTLVIVGAFDRVIPPDGGRELARRIPGAELVTLERSGHIGYAEEPEQFNRAVLQFLDQVERSGAA